MDIEATTIDIPGLSSFDSCRNLNKLSEENLRLLDFVLDGVLITDTDDKIIFVNESHALMEMLSKEDLIGRSAFELTRNGYCTKITLFDVEKLKSDLRIQNLIMVTKTGRKLLVTGIPLLDGNNQLQYIVYISRDTSKINELQRELEKETNLRSFYKNQLNDQKTNEMIYASSSMQSIVSIIHKVSTIDSAVFLLGESGVGKDLIANKIHSLGPWSDAPFIHVNCAAIPESLCESELFGYERGAYTGARKEGKLGLLELASGGTVYLDEITEMSPTMQAKLLQVLQEREFRRLGGTNNVAFSARVIASTNQNIQEAVRNKQFRQDLYYRICVIPIYIPPLRERKEDIKLLLNAFLDKFNTKYGQHKKFHKDIIKYFVGYDWPGNVRELEHVVERLVITADTDIISFNNYHNVDNLIHSFTLPYGLSLNESVAKVEMSLIRDALANNKNTREAASMLGISQATLLRKAHSYEIDLPNSSTNK